MQKVHLQVNYKENIFTFLKESKMWDINKPINYFQHSSSPAVLKFKEEIKIAKKYNV